MKIFGRATAIGAVACLVIGGVAHASSLGAVTARTLFDIDQGTSVAAPTVLGCDNFTGTTGASMAARAATVAASCANRVWTVHVGTWTIQTNKAASNSTASAVATQNVTTANSTAQVALTSLNTTGRTAGLVLSHDGASTYLAAVLIAGAPSRAELRIVAAGAPTVLTTVNTTINATNTLTFARSGSSVNVTLNGTLIITATLAASDLTTLGAGARSGLFGGDANVRFDDFQVTAP